MKALIKKERDILEILTDIYIFIMILIFPLMVDKTGFFHILECKWYSYLIISSNYIILTTLVYLYFWIFKKLNIFKYIKISKIQYAALLFLLINIVSCFKSPYFKDYDLFIGIGRGEGLINTSLYVITFLYVSLFGKFKRKYLLYFSIASILLNIICILQYIGFNPFNMYQGGIGTHNVSFMGTIGNIDFISAMYCILLTISFSSYIFLEDNKKYENIIHILSILFGSFIFMIINVESGKVAFLGTMVLLFPIIISTNKRLSKALIMLSCIIFGYGFNIVLNPVYHYKIQKLTLDFQFNYFVVLYLIICIALIYLSYRLKNIDYDFSKNKKILKKLYLSIFSCGVLGILFLFIFDVGSGTIHEMHELLHLNFNDKFGNYRIFLWKRTIKLIKEYPLLGSGPDTFAVRFMSKYTADVASIGPVTINDTAANVYLTMLINIGILGLFSYLSLIFFEIKEGIKKMNNYSRILLITIICFLIQDCFNLWVVIVTPVYWLLLALHFQSIKEKK